MEKEARKIICAVICLLRSQNLAILDHGASKDYILCNDIVSTIRACLDPSSGIPKGPGIVHVLLVAINFPDHSHCFNEQHFVILPSQTTSSR